MTSLQLNAMELDNLGNFIIVEPFFRSLRKKFPYARIATTLQLSDRFANQHDLSILTSKSFWRYNFGARMGGDFIGSDLVQLSTGYDFPKAVIEISLGHFQPPAIERGQYSGVHFYSIETPRVLNLINNSALSPEIVRAQLTSNEKKPLESSSDRGGYAIYQANRRFSIR